MLNQIRKFSLITLVIFGWLFSGFPTLEFADAAIGDIGHFRDAAGSQLPGTTFTAFNFNTSVRNDGIYTKPNDATIELDEAGTYLISATLKYVDGSNGRYNPQGRMVLSAGTGDVFTSYYSGYNRDNSENTAWVRVTGVVVNASADAQIQIQHRRDTDTSTLGSVSGASDVQVIRINPTDYGIYQIGGTGNTFGGTTPNTVDITAATSESSTAAIEGNILSETVTVKGDNKRYLVGWSVSGNTGGGRTQRIGHLEYDGVDELSTRAYCYQRNAANEYCGLGSMDIIETATTDIDIQVEVFRGPGVAADQGGANSDGSFITDGNGQMIVLEMPDYLEVFRSHDSTGVQNLSAAQTLNIARDVDFNDAASFTKASNTAVDVTNPADIFSWANIWTARNNIASGARQTSFGSITVNGVEQSTGQHGNYARGEQGTTDTFGMSFHPAGIFTVGTAGHDIGVNSDPLAGGEAGGTDRTQPNTLGFFALNLDTLVEPIFEQSAYRFFENIDSTDVGTALETQDTPATLAVAGDAFRLRQLINVSDNQLRQNETDFKLQFAERSGTCDPTFTGETYADVTASTVIAFNDNATPADGDNLTANANDPINGANIIVNQDYEELNNFTTSVSAIAEGQDGKWDFSLIDNGATANTSYCFRMVESDNTLLDTYSVIPEITIPNTFCPAPISSFPYTQGFEGSIGDWEQSITDDNDWDVNSGTTPSADTGPTSAIEGSDYIFVEASGNGTGYPDRRAIITSPCFDLTGQVSSEFSFQYHMYSVTGGTMGSIDLEISTDGTTWSSLFNETVNQGNQWNSETIDISAYVGQNVRLRFNRFVGNTWQADVAVDDINLDIVPQKILFDVFDTDTNNTIGHDLLSTTNVRYATGDETGSTTAVTAHNITASTNAANGYVIEMDGITLTSMDGLGTTIDAIGATATASTPGTEQFGLRLVPTGTGTASAPYNTANFAYDTANFEDIVATGTGDDTLTTFDTEFIANINPLTPAGNYTATVTYTMHGIF